MAAVSSISCCCCLGAPAPRKEGARAVACYSPSSSSLRRACVAAAACAVMGMADGGADMAVHALAARDGAAASRTDAVAVGARARPRWSDRRQCPPWRANSLENVVPENLPRPPARRRFNSVSMSAPFAPAPDLVALAPHPVLASRLGTGTGCFSL